MSWGIFGVCHLLGKKLITVTARGAKQVRHFKSDNQTSHCPVDKGCTHMGTSSSSPLVAINMGAIAIASDVTNQSIIA